MLKVDKSFDNYLFQLVASTPGYLCGTDEMSYTTRITLSEIFVPQGFSPNGDGINDTWHITGIDRYPNNRVDVYSRWEVKVFEKDGYNSAEEWDGTSNIESVTFGNNNLPEGTYYYIIDLGDNNSTKPIKGYIYIRRWKNND